MRHSLCLLLLFPLNVKTAWSQTLTGYVAIQNKKNVPAAPAAVRCVGGGASDAVINTTDGYFRLVFAEKSPGQTVLLEVLKPGYEVVNKNSLRVRLPEDPEEQQPLKIYICREGEWQQQADSFFQINYRQITLRQQKKLIALQERFQNTQITLETYQQEQDELQRQQALLLEEAGRMALLFATANLDEKSERFRRAARYFALGLIDSVLVALPEEDLLRDLEFARQQIAAGEMLRHTAAIQFGQAGVVRDSVLLLSSLLTRLQSIHLKDSVLLPVAGRILDAANAAPVAGATVEIAGWNGWCDAEGYFETVLVIPAGTKYIELSVQGREYGHRQVRVSRKDAGRIKLFLYKNE